MPRLEDRRLITGEGHYAGDIKLDRLLHAAFCRSTLPHARIVAVDSSVATGMAGVISVWTADDLPEVAAGLTDFTPPDIERRGRPILNRDELNYVGESYAMVIAETAYQAQDAAEQVSPEFDPLPGVGDVISATATGAPTVHAGMKSNVAQSDSIAFGDIEGAFISDSVTAKIRLTTARVAGAAMEPRAVTAAPDPESGGIKMWTSTQNVFGVRQVVASTLGIDADKVRVLAEDVG